MNHVLSENMDVFDIGCAHRSRGLAIVAPNSAPGSAATDAACQIPRIVLLLPDGIQSDHLTRCPTMEATGQGAWMGGSAVPTKVHPRKSIVFIEIFVVATADDAVRSEERR